MFDSLLHQGPMTIIFVFAMACMGAAIYLAFMLRRNEAKTEQRLKQARADITDMTILFQTMRDIIGQQKSLAKDFNEELEHKMGQVKHILNLSMEKNKQLYDKQQRIVAELEETQAQVDGLFRQIAHINKASQVIAAAPASSPPAPRPPAARPEPPSTQHPPAPQTSSAPRPTSSVLVRSATPDVRDLPAVPSTSSPTPRMANSMPQRNSGRAPSTTLTPAEEARLADTGVTKAPFSAWIAEDLLGANGNTAATRPPTSTSAKGPLTSRNPAPLDEEEPEPQAPGNGEAAREAFRALLNMPMDTGAGLPPVEMPGQTRAMTGAVTGAVNGYESNGNEAQLSIPLQQRVLEYSEAGMTVAEVSRELGIGKGEVRLMLSLARQAQPGQS